jgi:aspartyl-tRNA(Asn)/glutamyl-tRNA(Gln) amidotransferase subunit A
MVTVGKTCMVELAFGAWGTNRLAGTPRNPWDHERKRMPGGSSSGTAVAVAAAFGPVGIGTDTGGSVRIPAAMCGVVGFKPTQGQVPVDGLMALSPSLDTVGSITRTVADSALVYDQLAGTTVATGLEPDQLLPGRAKCRVGVLPEHALHDVEADVANAYSDTIDTLAAMGAEVAEFFLDQPFETLARKNGDLIAYEAWQIHGERIRAAPERMNPEVRVRFRAGEGITREEFQTAVEERERLCREMVARMEGIDVLMTPTTPISAIEVAAVDETSLLISRFTRPINYLGLCALAVPCGLDAKGLPLSVQFVCASGGDATLLNVGAAYERARGVFPAPDLSGIRSGQ